MLCRCFVGSLTLLIDEGTCGRRLAVSGVFKASDDRFKANPFYMSFTYPYVMGCLSGVLALGEHSEEMCRAGP